MDIAQNFVRKAIDIGAFEFPPEGVKLSSRRISPYFFNSGHFNTGERLAGLADTYARLFSTIERNNHLRPEVIYGPAYKGIALTIAVVTCLARHDNQDDQYRKIGWVYNRKEEKDHGEGGILVGHTLKGKRVAVLDDTMSTGESVRKAFQIIRDNGGIPVTCMVAFDRQERSIAGDTILSAVQCLERDHGVVVLATATLADLIQVFEEGYVTDPRLVQEVFPKILAYRDEYGIP